MKPARSRMNPQERKDLILDQTAALVTREGVSAVSMERVGREAGVSKALVYAYFTNRTELLQTLLLRDQTRLQAKQIEAARGARDVEDLVRLTTHTYLRHVEENGLCIERLMNEPQVAIAFREQDQKERRRAAAFLARALSEGRGVPVDIAELATDMAMGMTGTAGDLLSRGLAGRDHIEPLLLNLLSGAIKALTESYGRPDKAS